MRRILRRVLSPAIAASLLMSTVVCASSGAMPRAVDSSPADPSAQAEPVLVIDEARLDRPTLTSLGVQLLIHGDSDRDAEVSVRYREAGEDSWHDAAPLFRVRPEFVVGLDVPHQFAGSIFDLMPATDYEIELHAVDLDGEVDETISLSTRTRPVPRSDPANPRPLRVEDAASLTSALAEARPGDVISVAAGTYLGPFTILASGTPEDPIVIRGDDRDEVVLDGQACAECSVFVIHGSYVHLERLTFQNADRAIDFASFDGITGNVVRRVRSRNTRMGVLARAGQRDFYICDNIFAGRLLWPQTWDDDFGARSIDDGIQVDGEGHVVCHNELSGFGDAMKSRSPGNRAIDFYGNEVLWTYDNGLELDGSAGNTRALRNRFTNNYLPLSFQPIYGGPVYAIRNVAVNIANEQFKFHGRATSPPQHPSGMHLWHNSFVSPHHAVFMATNATSHFFSLVNNVFVGPERPNRGRTVSWDGPINAARIDYNGYFPDGEFMWQFPRGREFYSSFRRMQSSGMEVNGVLLDERTFASGLRASRDYRELLEPQDLTLTGDTGAIDRAVLIPNVNDDFTGMAPDLGALELGCEPPIYGVRPEGVDESNQRFGCHAGADSRGGR